MGLNCDGPWARLVMALNLMAMGSNCDGRWARILMIYGLASRWAMAMAMAMASIERSRINRSCGAGCNCGAGAVGAARIFGAGCTGIQSLTALGVAARSG